MTALRRALLLLLAAAADEQDERPRLFWMHVQKTGSAFGATIVRVGCPEFYMDTKKSLAPPTLRSWPTYCRRKLVDGSHQHTPYDPSFKGIAVTLLRDPADRLVSAYFFGRTHPMFPAGHDFKDLNDVDAAAAFARIAKKNGNRSYIDTYARTPGVAHCQTKAVLGRLCGDAAPLEPSDLDEALRRLDEDFLFVGAQAFFPESVRTLHAMLAPELEVDLHRLAESTSRIHRYTAQQRDGARAALERAGFHDAFDGPLYARGLARFRRAAARYGVALPERREELFEKRRAPEFRPPPD